MKKSYSYLKTNYLAKKLKMSDFLKKTYNNI